MMTRKQCAGFLEQIQENGGSDVMLEMLRLMVQTVLEEGITRHIGAQPYERGVTRRGYRNDYKPCAVKTHLAVFSIPSGYVVKSVKIM